MRLCAFMAQYRIDVEKTAKRITAALESSKETQTEIGARLGLDQAQISRYRRAQFTHYKGGVKSLCEYLRIKPHVTRVVFDPSKHRSLMNALEGALSGDPRNAKAVTALLRSAARLRRSASH